jgi:hypothetical protein
MINQAIAALRASGISVPPTFAEFFEGPPHLPWRVRVAEFQAQATKAAE